jgi:hypothetical protein
MIPGANPGYEYIHCIDPLEKDSDTTLNALNKYREDELTLD